MSQQSYLEKASARGPRGTAPWFRGGPRPRLRNPDLDLVTRWKNILWTVLYSMPHLFISCTKWWEKNI